MARKNKRLESVYYPRCNVSYELFLTPDNSFIATWGGQQIAAASTAGETHREARARLDELLMFVWQDAILIKFPEPSHVPQGSVGFLLQYKREEVAYDPNAKHWIGKRFAGADKETWYRSEIWINPRRTAYPGDRDYLPDAVSPLTLPVQTYKGGPLRHDQTRPLIPDELYIAYTPERWAILEEIARRLGELETRLRDLLGEPDLTTLAALILPKLLEGASTGQETALPGLLALPAPPHETLPAAPTNEVYCPGFHQPDCIGDPERQERHRTAPPCCDRAGEYNGFASGTLIFDCPNHCPCHD